MRVRLLISLLAIVLLPHGLSGEDTDFLIITHQSRHQEFKWHFQFSRFLATPEWDIENNPPPIDPSKAWQIAKKWMQKHGCDKPELISIQLSPLIRESDLRHPIDPRLTKRFYYTVDCIPAKFDIMVIYVLMDGSVLEPLQEPHKGMW